MSIEYESVNENKEKVKGKVSFVNYHLLCFGWEGIEQSDTLDTSIDKHRPTPYTFLTHIPPHRFRKRLSQYLARSMCNMLHVIMKYVCINSWNVT